MSLIRHENRLKSLSPKLGRFYCIACDRALVKKGGKCPVCKNQDPNKRFKKHKEFDENEY